MRKESLVFVVISSKIYGQARVAPEQRLVTARHVHPFLTAFDRGTNCALLPP